MKRSICIETLFTELPFNERFQAAKDAGFDYVEFWGWADKDLARMKKLADEAGVKFASMSGDRDYSLVDPEHKEKYIDFLKKSINAAKEIDCKILVIHSNALGDGGIVVNHYTELSMNKKICTMYDMLKEVAPLAEEAGVTLVLEALNTLVDHVGNFLETTQQGAEMIQTLNSPNVKLLYDVYHMQLNEGKICDTLSKYIKDIGYIHVADAPGRHEPGTGEINYGNVFKHLEQLGYDSFIGFELFPKVDTETAIKAIKSV